MKFERLFCRDGDKFLMDIKEIREHRVTLEKQIAQLIDAYEKATTCVVGAVELRHTRKVSLGHIENDLIDVVVAISL